MENLRKKYEEQTGENCENSQGEIDLDYILWLEKIHREAILRVNQLTAKCQELEMIILSSSNL